MTVTLIEDFQIAVYSSHRPDAGYLWSYGFPQQFGGTSRKCVCIREDSILSWKTWGLLFINQSSVWNGNTRYLYVYILCINIPLCNASKLTEIQSQWGNKLFRFNIKKYFCSHYNAKQKLNPWDTDIYHVKLYRPDNVFDWCRYICIYI